MAVRFGQLQQITQGLDLTGLELTHIVQLVQKSLIGQPRHRSDKTQFVTGLFHFFPQQLGIGHDPPPFRYFCVEINFSRYILEIFKAPTGYFRVVVSFTPIGYGYPVPESGCAHLVKIS